MPNRIVFIELITLYHIYLTPVMYLPVFPNTARADEHTHTHHLNWILSMYQLLTKVLIAAVTSHDGRPHQHLAGPCREEGTQNE